MFFKTKKIIDPNNVGEILQQARYRTGLSLKIAAKHVNINKKYLEALEKNEWHKLPGKIYAKNFLSQYLRFLSLDPKNIRVNFDQIYGPNPAHQQNKFRKKTTRWDFVNWPKLTKILIFSLIAACLVFYLVWQINQIIKPPLIELFYPASDLTLQQNLITLTGRTDPEVKLKINQQDVFLNQDNTFSQTINLQPGLNLIKIEGSKKYSKTRVIERKIIVE